MKTVFKLLLIVIATALMCSCSKINTPDLTNQDEMVTTCDISLDEAEVELMSFMDAFDPMTRNGERRSILNKYSVGGKIGTRSDDFEETPLIHIFNFNDNKGYAILAGDRRMPSILCITDEGNLDKDLTSDNPGLLVAMSDIDTYYRLMTGMPVTDLDGNIVPYEQYATDLFVDEITPYPGYQTIDGEDVYSYTYGAWQNYSTVGDLLDCNWRQGTPFNRYCFTDDGQQAVAGCVPIAVGQIMYHWKHSFNYNGTYWDWNKMTDIKKYSSSSSYTEGWDLVQKLIMTLGTPANLDATYGTSSTSAYSSNAGRTFENFGFTEGGELEDYDFTTLKNAVSNGPVLLRGNSQKNVTVTKALGITWKTETTYSNGHAWVCDQVLTRRRLVSVYKNGTFDYSYYETQNLVHCNWGWGGTDDGYYFSAKFDTNAGPETKAKTTTVYGTDYYYQYNLQMNCGIRAY